MHTEHVWLFKMYFSCLYCIFRKKKSAVWYAVHINCCGLEQLDKVGSYCICIFWRVGGGYDNKEVFFHCVVTYHVLTGNICTACLCSCLPIWLNPGVPLILHCWSNRVQKGAWSFFLYLHTVCCMFMTGRNDATDTETCGKENKTDADPVRPQLPAAVGGFNHTNLRACEILDNGVQRGTDFLRGKTYYAWLTWNKLAN